jgi:hypothetical protein
MNSNLFIITSVIDTPNIPLSYSPIRSIFTRDERFEQTKDTIKSIKEKMKDTKIMIVECSDYQTNKNELDYLKKNTDYFINLYDNKYLHQFIFGLCKKRGVSIMTIELLDFILENNLKFINYFFIGGRYYLNDNFNINLYNSNKIINFGNITLNITSTRLYKITEDYLLLYKQHLLNNLNNDLSYEDTYKNFCEIYKKDVLFLNENCVSGLIAVDGYKIN